MQTQFSMPRISPHFLILLFLIASLLLAGCSRPEVTPPNVELASSAYLDALQTGDLKQVDKLFFIPLHWRYKQKLYQQFSQDHEQISQKKLTLRMLSSKQAGRWGISIIESNQAGEINLIPHWFFYYDNQWQFVSPLIFKTKTVRSMLDLYREQKALRLWYDTETARLNPSSSLDYKKILTQ
ncbi:MAG: Unknown protein [uncultured Thiotrichaceae bacterium]|uniref:Uncharacterized protein n=1 Tax=uncultured Thiotrichaceae bacterium TaxID=298394 RepID=A0A6S6STZ0_9GAMM|nr:MAG: Unknown protein [uncultured Thiotrichaceae bacterium]